MVSHNCYARQSHTYLDLDAGQDFDSKIVVKVNAPERVRAELAAPRWRGEHVAMGTNVDCYQRAEGRYRLMPGILAALRDAANPFSILTKGTLILRDADLLAEAAEVTDVGLAVSVGCTDEDLWRVLEPGTPSPRRRLEVCAAFTGRGLGCAVLMGPVVPFLSDSPAQLAATVRQAGAGRRVLGHARSCCTCAPVRGNGSSAGSASTTPNWSPATAGLYGRGAYAPKSYQQRVSEQVRELARQYRVGQAAAPGVTGHPCGQPRHGQPRYEQPRYERSGTGNPGAGGSSATATQLTLL